jgi:hypothetical protein
MNDRKNLAYLVMIISLAACGGGGGGGGGATEDPLPCAAESCGKEAFRSAVPGKKTVRIDFPRTAARSRPTGAAAQLGPRGLVRPQLEAVAPAYLHLADEVSEINDVVDAVFAELEALVAGAPEIEEDTIHRWRRPDPDVPGNEEVLTLESDDQVQFALTYAAGPAGFELTPDRVVMSGDIHMVGGVKSDLWLTIDFDAATRIVPALALTGEIDIRVQPFAGGVREVWYDFIGFGAIGGELEDSVTTYWVFGEGDGALEYLDAMYDSDATVFARWEPFGGRLDYHVQWFDATAGVLDEIGTGCWAVAGAETFYGWALIDQFLNAFVEMDGQEEDCVFGPLDGHPDPGGEFANLPARGEWADLAASSVPFCEDDPFDPDCIYFCDLFPESC